MKYLITGGAGFIGSTLVRHVISNGLGFVVNVDKLTYAANLDLLSGVANSPDYVLEAMDICDGAAMRAILAKHMPDAIIHLAAESHVDRSIDGPAAFMDTNIMGTYRLLEAALDYYQTLAGDERARFRFHHVSTDEVFGSIDDGAFDENSRYAPRSPYSASKAAADHLAKAWYHTYGLPVVLSNSSNNYGPGQFPEKLIPLMIISAIEGRMLPVYGQGENVRDWLYVEDHAEALLAILRKGRPGETYLVGGNAERRNIDVVRSVCALLDALRPGSQHRPHENLIAFVEDRPGHDKRYAINSSKVEKEIGWRPSADFDEGLRRTVEWYLEHEAWWRAILKNRYAGERLGLAAGRRGAGG